MNILLPTPWFPNRLHPRHGNFVAAYAGALAARHRVHVVSVCPVESDQWATVIGPPQATGDSEKGRATSGKYLVRSGTTDPANSPLPYSHTTVYYPNAHFRLSRLWRRRQAWRMAADELPFVPDLVHAHVLIDGGIVGERLARRFDVPLLVSCHSSRFLQPRATGHWPDRRLGDRAARRAARLLPVSPALGRAMRARGVPGTYTVLPNLVDERTFFPPPAGHRSQDASFTFLHVSDASPNKRLVRLVDAFTLAFRQSDGRCRLRLAGDGDFRPALSRAEENGLPAGTVTASGPHPRAEIAGAMRAADAFVLNSGYETQSVVLLEALLCGLPVVTTAVGGAADIVAADPIFGTAVPPDDERALVAALSDLVNRGPEPDDRRQSRAGRAADRYGQRATLAQLESIYAEVLGDRGP